MNKRTRKRILVLIAVVMAMVALIFVVSDIAFMAKYNHTKDANQEYVKSIKANEIDSAFIMSKSNDLLYISPYEQHFEISGFADAEQLIRLNNANEVSDKVAKNADSTAGGRIRFRTDSDKISIKVTLNDNNLYDHFPLANTSGCDIYVGEGKDRVWMANFSPDNEFQNNYSGLVEFEGSKIREIMICLPTYSSVKSIQIGINKESTLASPAEYFYTQPIVFYGSSITQGCAASRPGTCYTELVARHFDANLYNLGFSSGAKGEKEMADYIATLDMNVLIIEYDHNASSVEELEQTHYNLYKTIRQSNKDIPIILLHRFSSGISVSMQESKERFEVIKNTYQRALEDGDENIYFIQSDHVIPQIGRDNYFVDGVHPNDLGMSVIADAIIQVLDEVLENGSH